MAKIRSNDFYIRGMLRIFYLYNVIAPPPFLQALNIDIDILNIIEFN